MSPAQASGVRAIVTDIEGTTSSIAFVKDVLFPYAREHLPRFVETHRDDPDVTRWLDATAREAGIEDPHSKRVVDTLLRWIDEDRKATPLKALQGMIWKAGYEARDYLAHVYPEVPRKLHTWKAQGLSLYVYSSGSVTAQKLFFAHTNAGDLTPCFDGWFDTGIGGKRERGSYLRIAETIDLPPPAIVFLSDVAEELDAARGAGMQTIQVCRPPGRCADAATHPCVADFGAIVLT
ncbi:MAG: 2,3-diketo-5-methylthiopentyl-1-phosphate enolase-phosphatase [Rhodanobacteraceae bacterium]|jgi:enolase-phosphatase E1|nr:MAG: 2,3-diketo-5-methylthiopentyl-1-phosphate enolase-phosphatase [Rhodanobacteraceae bacterium]